MILRFGSVLLLLTLIAAETCAQNVSGYAMMPDPFLFLLREPAVHADLDLSESQRRDLIELNESFDGTLLAVRNTTPEELRTQTLEIMKRSRESIDKLFTTEQKLRLRQIMYRLRGLSFVLTPDAAKALELTAQQKESIEAAVNTARESIQGAQSATYQGAEAHQQSQQKVTAARKREQSEILAALDDSQRRKLLELIGKRFDPRSLGRVTFKAPELSDGDQWINSDALKLTDLRGKVVALHFWAFG